MALTRKVSVTDNVIIYLYIFCVLFIIFMFILYKISINVRGRCRIITPNLSQQDTITHLALMNLGSQLNFLFLCIQHARVAILETQNKTNTSKYFRIPQSFKLL